MSSVRVPKELWAGLAVVFGILMLLFLLRGTFLLAVLSLALAIWTGLEASGNGAFGRSPSPKEDSDSEDSDSDAESDADSED